MADHINLQALQKRKAELVEQHRLFETRMVQIRGALALLEEMIQACTDEQPDDPVSDALPN